MKCSKCGRSSHNASTCYAKTHTIVYTKMRDYHGVDKVRGAGHTKSTYPGSESDGSES